MEKKLEILKLSIPGISELSARKLLGGDGYGLEEETTYTGWELPEVEVGYDRPEEWAEDPEMMMPDDAMDYEDWHQEDDRDINESLNDGFEEERNDDVGENALKQSEEEAKLPSLIEELPENLQKFIQNNNVKIQIDVNLTKNDGTPKPGQFANGVITLRMADKDYLRGELIHAIQDKLGLLNHEDHAMNEFQENLMRDLLRVVDQKEGTGLFFWTTTVTSDKRDAWEEELNGIVNDNGVVDYTKWENAINNYFDSFQERYQYEEKYEGEYERGYNYQWEIFFELFGISYK